MSVRVTIDGSEIEVDDGATLLDACRGVEIETPTLCYLENLTPVNACRVCVVEVEGSRALVPACSRPAEEGMVVRTDSERVRTSRRMVLELLATDADLSEADDDVARWCGELGVDTDRYDSSATATVAQDVKRQDELYVRDYARCILCYKCVEACGEDAQHTFAIAVAGRGHGAHISTEFDVTLPESACVYCGNCIGVCPTGALEFTSVFDLKLSGRWAPERQSVTTTVCAYCGVGCNLEVHVQDDRVVKVTSPLDHDVTNGHLCVKGRFGWGYVNDGS
ncbi:MAG: 2Fe-2S iron-sulfur cluster-binding protein [Actinomycetota bacterium]